MLGAQNVPIAAMKEDNTALFALLASTLDRKRDDHGDKMMYAVLLFIILVIVIVAFMAWRHTGDHKRVEVGGVNEMGGILAAIAASNMAHRPVVHDHNHGQYNYHMQHDAMRDNLREFGEIKKEIALSESRSIRDTDRATFENYKAIRDSEDRILAEQRSAEARRLDAELIVSRVTQNLAPKPPIPAFVPHYGGFGGNFASVNTQSVGIADGYPGYAI